MLKNFKKKYRKQMKKFHDFYFGIESEKPKKQKKPIKEKKFPIDSIWEFKTENPFKRFEVQIKEVKEGYILYRHCISRSMFQNESCSISSFLNMYKRK